MLKSTLLYLSNSKAAKKLATGTPLTRSMSRRFVPGERVADLVEAIREANGEGLAVTANYLGESVKDREAADTAARTYMDLVDEVRGGELNAGLSLKFTQMGQDIGDEVLLDNLGPLLERAASANVFIRFDMESSAYTQRTLDEFEKLWGQGVRGIGVVLQSYLHRTGDDVARMNELGAPVRLCKGAYAESGDVAFQTRKEVDTNFISQMKALLLEGANPGIATHDDAMIKATQDFAERRGVAKDRFEFQMLYGVRRDLQKALVKEGYRVRVYIPFGEQWYPYLMRRLAERPSNVIFLASSVLKEAPFGGKGS